MDVLVRRRGIYIVLVNGKRNGVSIKELTNSQNQNPFMSSKTIRFGGAYRRGSLLFEKEVGGLEVQVFFGMNLNKKKDLQIGV